jgi:hypothetical protein
MRTAIERYRSTEKRNPDKHKYRQFFRPCAGIFQDKARKDLPQYVHHKNRHDHHDQPFERTI